MLVAILAGPILLQILNLTTSCTDLYSEIPNADSELSGLLIKKKLVTGDGGAAATLVRLPCKSPLLTNGMPTNIFLINGFLANGLLTGGSLTNISLDGITKQSTATQP